MKVIAEVYLLGLLVLLVLVLIGAVFFVRHKVKKEMRKEFFDIFGVFPNDSNVYLVVAQKEEQAIDEAIKLMNEVDIKEMLNNMSIGDAKSITEAIEKPFSKLKEIDEKCKFFGIEIIPKVKEYPGKM